MSTEPQTAIAKIDPRQSTLKGLFDRSKGAIAQVLPRHMTADRILKVTLAATSRTPKLLECTQTSILQSVMQAAQLGLEPGGPLGHAYLVPYGAECQLIVGYRGLIDLARRSGQIDSIEARVVYERDKFKVSYGLNQVLEHEPFMGDERGAVLCVYAIARIKDALPQVEVMSRAQVDVIRAMSKTGKFGPWKDHYEEMARKTVVRRLCKYLPLTIELAEALEADERGETEVDAGAFAAIPVEITEDKSPLAAKLEERADQARAKKPAGPTSEPVPLEYDAMLTECQTQAEYDAALARITAVAPKDAAFRPALDRLIILTGKRVRGEA